MSEVHSKWKHARIRRELSENGCGRLILLCAKYGSYVAAGGTQEQEQWIVQQLNNPATSITSGKGFRPKFSNPGESKAAPTEQSRRDAIKGLCRMPSRN